MTKISSSESLTSFAPYPYQMEVESQNDQEVNIQHANCGLRRLLVAGTAPCTLTVLGATSCTLNLLALSCLHFSYCGPLNIRPYYNEDFETSQECVQCTNSYIRCLFYPVQQTNHLISKVWHYTCYGSEPEVSDEEQINDLISLFI